LFEAIKEGRLVGFADRSAEVEATILEDADRSVILGKVKEGIVDTGLAVGQRTAGAVLGYKLASAGVGEQAGVAVVSGGANTLMKKVLDFMPAPEAPEQMIVGWNTFGNILQTGKSLTAEGAHKVMGKSIDVVTENILGPVLGPLAGRVGTFFGTGALVGAGIGLYREYRRGSDNKTEMEKFVSQSDAVIGDAEI